MTVAAVDSGAVATGARLRLLRAAARAARLALAAGCRLELRWA